MKKICLCQYCIEEIRSRGEKIYVSNEAEETTICEWCKEEDEIFDCVIE